MNGFVIAHTRILPEELKQVLLIFSSITNEAIQAKVLEGDIPSETCCIQ
jgi:hypothetical protein